MTKTLVFKVKRVEVLEYRVPFEGEPPWTEEELALGDGLVELYEVEAEDQRRVDSDVVWEGQDELEPGSYRVEEVP